MGFISLIHEKATVDGGYTADVIRNYLEKHLRLYISFAPRAPTT